MHPFTLAQVQNLCQTLEIPMLEFDKVRMDGAKKEEVVVLKKIKFSKLQEINLKFVVIELNSKGNFRRRGVYYSKQVNSKKKKKRETFYHAKIRIGTNMGESYGAMGSSQYFIDQIYRKKNGTLWIKHEIYDPMSLLAPICILLSQKDIDKKKFQALISHTIIKLIEIVLGSTRIRKQKLEDICGYEKEKEELLKIVKLRLNPKKIKELSLSSRNPILTGHPGNGKSMILRALANYAEEHEALVINFNGYMKLELWLPVISDLTQSLEIPVFICIDEIDEIGVARDIERSRVYEFLRLLDGLADLSNVTFIATTNRPHLIDIAMLRPERFNPIYKIGLPISSTRKKLIKFYCKKFKIKLTDKNLDLFVTSTKGWSCADIRGILEDMIYNYEGKSNFPFGKIIKRIKLVSKEKIERNKTWDDMMINWKKKLDVDINVM